MHFKDAKEREAVLGPLFATEAKSAIPVFGPDRIKSEHSQLEVKAFIKEALKSSEHSVMNMLEPSKLSSGPSILAVSSMGAQPEQLTKGGNVSPDHAVPASMYSSRELHDISHFSSISLRGSTKSLSEKPENVLLRRAQSGYLFDCKHNKSILSDDIWLQDVWDWIDGKSCGRIPNLNLTNRQEPKKPQLPTECRLDPWI